MVHNREDTVVVLKMSQRSCLLFPSKLSHECTN